MDNSVPLLTSVGTASFALGNEPCLAGKKTMERMEKKYVFKVCLWMGRRVMSWGRGSESYLNGICSVFFWQISISSAPHLYNGNTSPSAIPLAYFNWMPLSAEALLGVWAASSLMGAAAPPGTPGTGIISHLCTTCHSDWALSTLALKWALNWRW